MIVSNENLLDCLDHIFNSPVLSLDTETTGLNAYTGDRLFSVIVGTAHDVYYFNFQTYDEVRALHRNRLSELYDAVKGKKIYFGNSKFDMHFLSKEGWGTDYSPWDVLVVDKCIYNRHLSYSLDNVAKRMGLGEKLTDVMDYIKEHKLFDKVQIEGKKTATKNPRFDKVPFHIISEYAIQDARLTYQIGVKQEQIVDELTEKYSKINGYPVKFRQLIEDENRLTKVLFDMEKRGMELDLEYIEKAKAHEKERIEKSKEAFLGLTGYEFTDSAKHLTQVFGSIGICGGTTAKGNASFTDDVLKTIDHEAAKVITEYRDAYKRLNTYYNSFTNFADQDGVVRPSVKQTAADTFRFSIVNPALQTLNSEDDGEWRVRDSFRARQGFVFCSIDYAAQEYRLTADYAGERDLISQIKAGVDVHSATASMMKVDRFSAKVLNFALLYGAQAPKIAGMLKVPVEKATELKNLYFAKLGNISRFIMTVKNTIDRRGFIFNFAGRVLHFPVIEFEVDGKKRTGNFAYKGPNYIIQSSGSEIMRRALLHVHEFLLPYKSKIVLSVHDELLLELHESELHLIPEIRRLMCIGYPSRNGLEMDTSVAIGKSWGRLEELDENALTERIDIQKAGTFAASEDTEDCGVYHSASIYPGNPGSFSFN
jgi:DNA polymerase-1